VQTFIASSNKSVISTQVDKTDRSLTFLFKAQTAFRNMNPTYKEITSYIYCQVGNVTSVKMVLNCSVAHRDNVKILRTLGVSGISQAEIKSLEPDPAQIGVGKQLIEGLT
jgi:hypothetical protein